ncbi:MAG: hypothetical protein AB1571_01315 [Nanoarchaeota archaeon]
MAFFKNLIREKPDQQKLSEEAEEVYSLMMNAESSSLAECTSYLKKAKELMDDSFQKGIYEQEDIQKILAKKLLEQMKLDTPIKESLEELLFIYGETMNGLVDKIKVKDYCFEYFSKFSKAKIRNLLDILQKENFDLEMFDHYRLHYELLKTRLKEIGVEEPEIEIGNGKILSDEAFYVLSIRNLNAHLKGKTNREARDFIDKLTGKIQDRFYEKLEIYAQQSNKEMFEKYYQALLRFTKEFSNILEEDETEIQNIYNNFTKQYFNQTAT